MNLILELLTLKDEIGELKRMMFSYVEDNYKPNVEEIKLQREMELQEEIEEIKEIKEQMTVYHIPTMEKDMLINVIKKYPSNIKNFRSAQARALGLPKRNYYRRLKKYNLYESK